MLIAITKVGAVAEDPQTVFINPEYILIIEPTNVSRGTKKVHKIVLTKDFGYNHIYKEGIKTTTQPKDILEQISKGITISPNPTKLTNKSIKCDLCGVYTPIDKLNFNKKGVARCSAKSCDNIIYRKKTK